MQRTGRVAGAAAERPAAAVVLVGAQFAAGRPAADASAQTRLSHPAPPLADEFHGQGKNKLELVHCRSEIDLFSLLTWTFSIVDDLKVLIVGMIACKL